MKSTSLFPNFPGRGAIGLLVAASLAGCSTVGDISPFGSNVPYAQDVKPTIAQPAVTEVPAFKPAPVAQKPVASPPKASPPPVAAPPEAPPAASPPSPPAQPSTQSALPSRTDQQVASTAPRSNPSADRSASQAASASAQGTPGHPVLHPAGVPPEIAASELAFKDDGTYPNLAQVPARPVNMPTFLEASSVEKTLIADRETAKDKEPDSPPAPSPESLPSQDATAPAAASPAAVPAAIAERAEDRAPCLSPRPSGGEPAATIHFQPGSAALSSDDMIVLADAIPAVRGGSGTIRVFGHGDTDSPTSETARFDLAVARAGAVAQALAGYGIAVPRIAVGVACADASFAGASVQLYTES